MIGAILCGATVAAIGFFFGFAAGVYATYERFRRAAPAGGEARQGGAGA